MKKIVEKGALVDQKEPPSSKMEGPSSMKGQKPPSCTSKSTMANAKTTSESVSEIDIMRDFKGDSVDENAAKGSSMIKSSGSTKRATLGLGSVELADQLGEVSSIVGGGIMKMSSVPISPSGKVSNISVDIKRPELNKRN